MSIHNTPGLIVFRSSTYNEALEIANHESDADVRFAHSIGWYAVGKEDGRFIVRRWPVENLPDQAHWNERFLAWSVRGQTTAAGTVGSGTARNGAGK